MATDSVAPNESGERRPIADLHTRLRDVYGGRKVILAGASLARYRTTRSFLEQLGAEPPLVLATGSPRSTPVPDRDLFWEYPINAANYGEEVDFWEAVCRLPADAARHLTRYDAEKLVEMHEKIDRYDPK
ncbi:MAG: hypothetical protein ACOYNI_07890, partial [Acidimicrobiia bacterium]